MRLGVSSPRNTRLNCNHGAGGGAGRERDRSDARVGARAHHQLVDETTGLDRIEALARHVDEDASQSERVEARIDAQRPLERTEQRRRRGEHDQRRRDLRNDEHALRARTRTHGAARAVLHEDADVRVRDLERGNDRDQQRDAARHDECRSECAPVERELDLAARRSRWSSTVADCSSTLRDRDADRRREKRDRARLDDDLAHQRAARGAQRKTRGQLAALRRGAHQNQSGDVRAGDEEKDGNGDREQAWSARRVGPLAGGHAGAFQDPNAPALVLGIRRGELRRQRIQLASNIGDRRGRRTTSNDAVRSQDPHPQILRRRIGDLMHRDE